MVLTALIAGLWFQPRHWFSPPSPLLEDYWPHFWSGSAWSPSPRVGWGCSSTSGIACTVCSAFFNMDFAGGCCGEKLCRYPLFPKFPHTKTRPLQKWTPQIKKRPSSRIAPWLMWDLVLGHINLFGKAQLRNTAQDPYVSLGTWRFYFRYVLMLKWVRV